MCRLYVRHFQQASFERESTQLYLMHLLQYENRRSCTSSGAILASERRHQANAVEIPTIDWTLHLTERMRAVVPYILHMTDCSLNAREEHGTLYNKTKKFQMTDCSHALRIW